MADPKRLVERLGPGFERDLLLVGAGEEPEAGARARVHAHVLEAAAVAAAAAAGASAAGASTAGGKASSALGLVMIKWLSVGAVLGTVSAYVGSELSSPERAERPRHDAASGAAPTAAPRVVAPSLAIAPSITPEVTVEGRPAPSGGADPAESRGDVRIGAPATLVEADSMRRIRAEARMNQGRALRLVDEHLMRFPNGESAAEARRLRATLAARLGVTDTK